MDNLCSITSFTSKVACFLPLIQRTASLVHLLVISMELLLAENSPRRFIGRFWPQLCFAVRAHQLKMNMKWLSLQRVFSQNKSNLEAEFTWRKHLKRICHLQGLFAWFQMETASPASQIHLWGRRGRGVKCQTYLGCWRCCCHLTFCQTP